MLTLGAPVIAPDGEKDTPDMELVPVNTAPEPASDVKLEMPLLEKSTPEIVFVPVSVAPEPDSEVNPAKAAPPRDKRRATGYR